MSDFSRKRREALEHWKALSNRVTYITDNFSRSYECNWQRKSRPLGYKHISLFCSFGQFVSHLTDLLRDNRFDEYNYGDSKQVDALLFRFYSRILLIVSEIITDFQDVYIMASNQYSTKQMNGLNGASLRVKQDEARLALAYGKNDINNFMDYVNKICKHKASNFHICNHHVDYLFRDSNVNMSSYRSKIDLGNINNFTSYDKDTFRKHNKPKYIVTPSFLQIVNIVIDCYEVLDDLFERDQNAFKFVCELYEDK